MSALFHVNIILPGRVAYDAEASSLIVPAYEGYLGVLAHHAPIITELKTGTIKIRDANNKTTHFNLKSGGFLEVSENRATLLVDSLEFPS